MGRPVVHFEITGKDGGKLQSFYSDLFEWDIDANNPMNYGSVERYTRGDGAGIGGGIAQGPEGYEGHVTFYVEVPDVEATLKKAEGMGATRMMGPEKVMEGVTIALFTDPEGHVMGIIEEVP
ncbi:MAG: glyoxalase [Actinomycetota bacterium]|nr:glyoxalase [Actinomycetota bacterium]